MGIHITKLGDPELYAEASAEAQRLLTISSEIRVTVQQVAPRAAPAPAASAPRTPKAKSEKRSGFCIRTGVEIPFDINRPLSAEALRTWKRYKDRDYGEKYCHFSGEDSEGETSVSRPILKKNWSKATDAFGKLSIDDESPLD